MSSEPGFASLFGPGRLVLVVGPSGAGKDTLIRLVRGSLQGDPRIVFPRRLVTRPTSEWEDHDSIEPRHFEAGARFGLYPLHWRAHGLSYALPVSIITDVACGRTVVANVSRTAVREARGLFERVDVVYVTAPGPVLSQRIAARGREAAAAGRVARQAAGPEECGADCVIENVGDPGIGARRLLEVVTALAC